MRQTRRARYEGYSHEQAIRALADDMDEMEGVVDEHIEDDMDAHRAAADAFVAWKLEGLQASRRQTYALVIAMVPILISLLVLVATR